MILAAAVGNALEFYDFIVFGYFAIPIARAYFPSSPGARPLLLTFGTYGVSFLARPLGAIVLGGLGDRHGRRAALSVSILLMTLGTLLTACMPGYDAIGRLAPVGILAARLLQGFSTGGEFGAATAFMVEHASPRRRDLFASLQFVTQMFSSVIASAVALAVTAFLTPASLQAWGFRIPFVLGLAIAPVGLYLRRHVDETPAFMASAPPEAPVRQLVRAHGVQVVLAAGLIAGATAGTYLEIYMPTFAQTRLHIDAADSFLASLAVSVVGIVVTLLAADRSDRSGRFHVLAAGLLTLLAVIVPAFRLIIAYPGVLVLATMQIMLTIPRAIYAAPVPGMLADLFPPAVRVIGASLGYTLGVVLFGGFVGLVVQWLMDITGDPLVPAYYLAVATIISLAAALAIRQRSVRASCQA